MIGIPNEVTNLNLQNIPSRWRGSAPTIREGKGMRPAPQADAWLLAHIVGD